MATTGIICEYNPFHRGHGRQISCLRQTDPAGCIVCLMSGEFVQRGHPAVFSPAVRARAALLAGADLVLELPINVSLSSAEGFAQGGVKLLHRLGVDRLCFGSETADMEKLTAAAQVLLSPDFSVQLRQELNAGVSFPTARCRAVTALGADPEVLTHPNDILAVEYTKAALMLEHPMALLPIDRSGDYHAEQAQWDSPSATALRRLILSEQSWLDYVPEAAQPAFQDAVVHSLAYGERAILGRLRSMDEAEFATLPYGSEGLWRKLMRESRRGRTLEDILAGAKSKRYTRSRLDRMVMCAFLGLTQEDMRIDAPYIRVLACNDRGRVLLRRQEKGFFINLGQRTRDHWAEREARIHRLYGLFARQPEAPEQQDRITVLSD